MPLRVDPFKAFIAVGFFHFCIYFCIALALIGGFKWLENRWFAHLRPREQTATKRVRQPG